MTEDEKNTVLATMAAHEEVIATLLSRVLSELPQDQLDALHERMQQGPVIRPDAPALDLDMADRVAGIGIEYDEVMQRIYTRALGLAGRSVQ